MKEKEITISEGKEIVTLTEEVTHEVDIKEAVKKAAQRPVTVIKKGGRKKA